MTRFVTALALAAALAAPSLAAAQAPSLKNPASLTEKAPDTYKVKLDTSAGPVVIEVHRDWAPLGADRFYNLVKNGFYDGVRFFRVIPGFMAQGGMNADPAIQKVWGRANFNDDPVKQSNKRGYVTFAKTNAPNSRSTQFYINYADNSALDSQGFAPFGQVTSGMEAVDKFETYGRNNVPDQGMLTAEGEAYLKRDYPKLTVIKKATIENPAADKKK